MTILLCGCSLGRWEDSRGPIQGGDHSELYSSLHVAVHATEQVSQLVPFYGRILLPMVS